MNCTQCGNTGLVPVEKGPAGATYTVLARCKCQTDTVTIPRAQYEALRAAAGACDLLEKAEDFNANDCRECEGEGIPEACPICFPLFDDARVTRRNALAALRAAGIQDNTND